MFEIKARDGLARIGSLKTPHGTIETPVLLPVINPNIQTVSIDEMRRIPEFQAIITNSYIIRKSEKLRGKALSDGVHSLVGFDGPIMTDSGTFQSHVYGDVDVTPEEIVTFQKDIGVDIGTVLDVFTEPEDSFHKAEREMNTTIKRCLDASKIKGDMLLACTVQGGVFPNLRRKCAESLSEMDCDIHPIGGVVPVMENQWVDSLVDIIVASKKGLTPARPVHLFGAGHPMIIGLATLLGVDIFDSSSYAKFAAGGRMLFQDGTWHLEDMEYLPCNCPTCSGHTAKELQEEYKAGNHHGLALHNLYQLFLSISKVKQAIKEGCLYEQVERELRAHPAYLDGLYRLVEHAPWLEKYAGVSHPSSFFYTGPESMRRPAVVRFMERLVARYTPDSKSCAVVVFPEPPRKPYAKQLSGEVSRISSVCNVVYMVESGFGLVPLELDEMYPIAQSVFPKKNDAGKLPIESRMSKDPLLGRITKKLGIPAMLWEGPATIKKLEALASAPENGMSPGSGTEPGNGPNPGSGMNPGNGADSGSGTMPETFDVDIARVRAVCDIQFGKGAADILLSGELKLAKSRSTGKVRNVFCNGEHVLSMRASEGLFTLKLAGGRLLHEALPHPRMRVVVDTESAEFNRAGRNVFSKFVRECDPKLRPWEEALVVDQEDTLVAVGRPLLTKDEMLAFESGVAVKVRDGVGN